MRNASSRSMQEGVILIHAFVQCTICSPSRACFLTGCYPHITRLRANGQRIRPDEKLVTKTLADHSYECDLAGKLHLSPCQGGRDENWIDDGYDLFWWSHDISDAWPGKNMWRVWLKSQGVKWPTPPPHTPVWEVPIDPLYTQTAWCADKAITMIREEQGYQPWLISVNPFQPHAPFLPTEEYSKRYDPAKMPPLRCSPPWRSIAGRFALNRSGATTV